MDSDNRVTKGEVWVPAGRWRHRRNWRNDVDGCWPDNPGWYEPRPVKRRPAVTVIGVLWIVIPCLLLLGQHFEEKHHLQWREFSSQVSIREKAPVRPAEIRADVVETVCDPAWSLVDRISILSESTDEARSRPDDFEIELSAARTDLARLLTVSKTMTLPLELRRGQELTQLSLLSAGQALDALEVALFSTNPEDKARFYGESLEQIRSSRDKLWEARELFDSYSPRHSVCSPPGYSDG